MRTSAIAIGAMLFLTAAPAFAASPLVCGVREETPAMAKAKALVEGPEAGKAPDKAPEPSPDGASGFREPNDRLFLVSLDDKAKCSETSDGRCKWGLTQPLTYQPHGTQDLITVPRGFTTDLASIPSFAWPFLPADGPWLKAAVVHDFLYKTCGRGQWQHQPYGFTRKGCEPGKDCYTRKEADKILREAMADRGVGPTKASIIYTAVRWFGHGGWGH